MDCKYEIEISGSQTTRHYLNSITRVMVLMNHAQGRVSVVHVASNREIFHGDGATVRRAIETDLAIDGGDGIHVEPDGLKIPLLAGATF